MATKIKINPGKEKPSPEEIAKANEILRRIAVQKNLANATNLTVGNTIPKFIDAATNKELPPNADTGSYSNLPRVVPSYVKELSWDNKDNVPYYIDEKTGYIQQVHPDVFYSPRFNPNRGKTNLLASKMK